MKRLTATTIISTLGLAVLGALVPLRHTRAAPQGIVVSPALQEVLLAEADLEATFDFSLLNKNPMPVQVSLTALDFGALDESGGVAFIGNTPGGQETKYGLRNWMTFSQDVVLLEPDRRVTVKAIITNRAALGPGGHYGAVVATPIDGLEARGDNKVDIVPSSSVLVFLKKAGGEHYDLKLSSLSFDRSLLKLPGSATLRFQNAGNVHVVPRGLVTVTNGLGKPVARGPINTESGIILPDTFRKYTTDLRRLARFNMPGRYTVKAEYRYDGSDEIQTQQSTFYYFGPLGYVFLIPLLAIAAFIIWRRKRKKGGPAKTGAPPPTPAGAPRRKIRKMLRRPKSNSDIKN